MQKQMSSPVKTSSMSRARESESVDDYVKTIYMLSGDRLRQVGNTEIADQLHIAPASATNMLQRLAAAATPLIRYERHRGVTLTDQGRHRALEIVRHHRLIETFLFEVLHYPIEELHDEAERLEHFISEKFEERIAALLGNPQTDPHGHCIPSLSGIMPESHRVTCTCP